MRSRTGRSQHLRSSAQNDDESQDKENRARYPQNSLVFVSFIVVFLLIIGSFLFNYGMPFWNVTYTIIPATAVHMEENVHLVLDFQKDPNSKNITLGPHRATLIISKLCREPLFLMRIVGDEALYSIAIVQVDESRWNGTFHIPFPGSYVLEPRWYGCQASEYTKNIIGESMQINVSGDREPKQSRLTPTHTSIPNLFLEGFWAAPILYTKMPNKRFWITRDMGTKQPHFVVSSTQHGESLVAKEATPIHPRFGDLSNYELMCWIGSESAATIRNSFKSLLPSLAKHQKPFKFHYYPMDDFRRPDREWDTENKLRVRKCKIIIISVDELRESITQDDYRLQVTMLLKHLVKMFDDDSFPIWMLTVNQPSVSNSTSQMCTRPSKLRTNHHPCNDVLFEMFGGYSNLFPSRVRLLDNTDLTDPLLDEGLQDAVAVIAMRIFAIAGEQVNWWRLGHQKGVEEGLQRNGIVEPNIQFGIYNFNE